MKNSTKKTRLAKLRQELNPKEKSIVALEKACDTLKCEKSREFAVGLVTQYRAKGFLTEKQWYYVGNLLRRPKNKQKNNDPVSIYVIECGDAVKIGMSSNVDSRLKSLQTGASEETVVLYQREVGVRSKTRSIESKIHRFCREHHIRGEWFTRDALPKVHQFFSKIEKKHKLPPVKQDSV